MSFYIRKPFRFGPIRLNLSKSGFGFSGGVKGCRLGINAQGRPYTHMGRYGLYYRNFFGNSKHPSEKITRTRRIIDEIRDTPCTVQNGLRLAIGTIVGTVALKSANTGNWGVAAVLLVLGTVAWLGVGDENAGTS